MCTSLSLIVQELITYPRILTNLSMFFNFFLFNRHIIYQFFYHYYHLCLLAHLRLLMIFYSIAQRRYLDLIRCYACLLDNLHHLISSTRRLNLLMLNDQDRKRILLQHDQLMMILCIGVLVVLIPYHPKMIIFCAYIRFVCYFISVMLVVMVVIDAVTVVNVDFFSACVPYFIILTVLYCIKT